MRTNVQSHQEQEQGQVDRDVSKLGRRDKEVGDQKFLRTEFNDDTLFSEPKNLANGLIE